MKVLYECAPGPTDPKMTLESIWLKVSHINYVLLVSLSPKYQATLLFKTYLFQVTGHFEQMYQTTPPPAQLTINTTTSKVPHIFLTEAPKSQITVHFAIPPAIFFTLIAILRQVHHTTTKLH